MNIQNAATDFILAQEAAGQKALVRSEALPSKGDWDSLEAMGIVKGESVDDLFCHATLPDGWSKVASNHSMWSYLKDERGLTRASVFYKAAFYDRDAFVRATKARFFSSKYEPLCDKQATQVAIVDAGTGLTVKLFSPVVYATLNGTLGAVISGQFFSETVGSEWDARFSGEGVCADDAVPMTNDDFYKNYHHVSARHDIINAADKLAHREATLWLESVPADSQWTAEFDLPVLSGGKK
jgi:hypothetical protein